MTAQIFAILLIKSAMLQILAIQSVRRWDAAVEANLYVLIFADWTFHRALLVQIKCHFSSICNLEIIMDGRLHGKSQKIPRLSGYRTILTETMILL